MELIVRGKNFEVPEAVREYADKKLGKLDRFLSNITEVVVEISQEDTKGAQHRQVVQVTMNSKGVLLRGEERADDYFTAIDAVTNTMKRQMNRYKTRLQRRGRGSQPLREMSIGSIEKDITVGDESEVEMEGNVVKIKRFAIKPMPPEEALSQMELLGHDFFFFLNATTEQYNVVYRRRDGHYGLIEPDL
jgi:putative sigma-54 modulation protein